VIAVACLVANENERVAPLESARPPTTLPSVKSHETLALNAASIEMTECEGLSSTGSDLRGEAECNRRRPDSLFDRAAVLQVTPDRPSKVTPLTGLGPLPLRRVDAVQPLR
jgi:hypothetical protein